MLKYKFPYEDFDGEKQEEEFYFNINKSELLELEVEHKQGLQEYFNELIKSEDTKVLFAEFKKLVLLAYGEKSQDGKKFIKTEEISREFSNHAAFDAMITRFATEEDAFPNFMKGVLPKDLMAEVEKELAKKKSEETKEPTTNES